MNEEIRAFVARHKDTREIYKSKGKTVWSKIGYLKSSMGRKAYTNDYDLYEFTLKDCKKLEI